MKRLNDVTPEEWDEVGKTSQTVALKILGRAKVGKAKYGVTLDREDLTPLEWLIHLQEELLDAAGYVEKLIGLERAR